MPRSRADWDEELAAGMLEDLEELSGISIGEMMADAITETEEYEVHPIYEEPDESEEFDLKSVAGSSEDYFDGLFDDLDIDPADEEDSYGDEGV